MPFRSDSSEVPQVLDFLLQGVPKDSNTEGTLRACLGEIDRCYQDNIMPFFLNMTRYIYRSI